MAGFTMALAVLPATLLAAAGMAGLGALVLRFQGEAWADLGVGWGVLGLALLLTSAMGLPVLPALLPLLLGGLLAFAWRCRPGRATLLLALLVVPLLLLAAAMPITAWDDYSHWLANARYLLRHDSFPREGLPQPVSWHGGYPYGVALVTYAASLPLRVLGVAPLAETAAPVFSLLLLASLAAGLVARAGRPATPWVVALVVLLVFWLNPGFVPRIVFTNYGEAPTTALLALAALLLLRPDRAAQWQAALVLAAVVNVKQTGLVLALLMLAGAALLALAERRRPWHLAVLAGPMLLTWWLWQPHAAAGGVFGFKPLAEWAWPMAWQTLASIGTVMLRKIFFTLLLLAMLGLAVLALWRGRRDPAARLALLAAPMLAGWPAFLFLTYMGGSFAPDEVVRAASFWRYGTQLGGLLMAGVALLLLAQPLPRPLAGLLRRRWPLPAACAALLLLPLAGFNLLWPNKREAAPPLRRTLAALAPAIPPGSVLAVMDPTGNGFGAVVTDFALQGRARVVLPARAYGSVTLDEATLRERLDEDQPSLALQLSSDAASLAVLATPPLPPGQWRLLRAAGTGWEVAASGQLGAGPRP